MSNIEEVTQNYFCECCKFETERKYNFSRHMLSKKHLKKMNGEETSSVEGQKRKTRKPRVAKNAKNVIKSDDETITSNNETITSDNETISSDGESVYSDITSDIIIEHVEIGFQSDVIIEHVEIGCQTEMCDEMIEMQIETLKKMYETQIEELKKMYEIQINELKEKNETLIDDVELLRQEKEELQQQVENTDDEILKNDEQLESLKNDNETLTHQKQMLENKIIYDLNCQMQDLMEMIEEKKMLKEFNNEVKFGQEKQETNDEIIINLRNKIDKIGEFVERKIKNIETDEPKIKMMIEEPRETSSNLIEHEEMKEQFKLLNVENIQLTNDIIELEEELKIVKEELSKINVEKYTPKNDKNDKNKKTNKTKDNSKNPMEIYKELCYDTKFNNKIVSHSSIDKSNKCEITKMNILKSINDEDYQTKPTKIYLQIFTSVIEEMNDRNIKFIRCVDDRRNKFEIHDGVEWNKINKFEFEDIIKILLNHINNSFYGAILNTSQNIDDSEFFKIYKKTKEYFLSEVGTKNKIILSILNPLYDDTLNFMKTIMTVCKKLSISKKSSKKSSKKRRRHKDDESESESDSESDSEDD